MQAQPASADELVHYHYVPHTAGGAPKDMQLQMRAAGTITEEASIG
jgi:hypothetical protein